MTGQDTTRVAVIAQAVIVLLLVSMLKCGHNFMIIGDIFIWHGGKF